MSGALAAHRRGRAVLYPLMLASGFLLAGCLASPIPSAPTFGESPAPTTPLAPSPSPTTPAASGDAPEETLPPLNRLEVTVIDALGQLGITGERAELPFEDASIYAELTTGQLFVKAGPTKTRGTDLTVIDERQIEGIRVQRIQYTSGPPVRNRFECSSDTYEIWGAVPADVPDTDTLIARFIRALGCGA